MCVVEEGVLLNLVCLILLVDSSATCGFNYHVNSLFFHHVSLFLQAMAPQLLVTGETIIVMYRIRRWRTSWNSWAIRVMK